MTLKSYLWGMRVSTFFALASCVLVVYYIDPTKSGFMGQLFFYVSTFLFLAGLFVLFFTWAGKRNEENENSIIHIGVSFRQGILLSVLILVLLFFQQKRILTWWDGSLVVAGIFLIELYFLSHKK